LRITALPRLIFAPAVADTESMQRLCEVRGGVSAYLRNPDMLVTESTRKCPFCAEAHELCLHGWYWRQAIFPAGGGCVRVPVRRRPRSSAAGF
jgi:hypothetical protein